MDKIIKVTGRGNATVTPDLMCLNIRLESLHKEYDVTLQQSSKMTQSLREILEAAGFAKEELKTTHFDIHAVNENVQTEDGNWKQQLKGYQFEHSFKVEFLVDNARLGKILYALANSELCPILSIQYTVSDVESLKNKLLGQAVKDAKEKAKIIAEAAEVQLGSIAAIDYSWEEKDIFTSPVEQMELARCMSRAEESYDLNLQADDIRLTDTITVTWKLS